MALKKTHAQFRAALRFWDAEDAPSPELRAIRACWWFIENVTEDDPARSAIFFELREMVREVEHSSNSPALHPFMVALAFSNLTR